MADAGVHKSAGKPRKSGIVVPRKLTWRHHLAAWLIASGVRLLSMTWRCTFVDPHGIFKNPSGQYIAVVWHNRLALATTAWRYFRKMSPAGGLVALISASHDGGILSRALDYFDVKAVRGSSSRRGPQALLELTSYVDRKFHVAITPDGPRGPRYQVQDGALALAQISGIPIVPVGARIRGKITLKSWDQFQVPLPFARCEIRFGELLTVPREATEEQRAELRGELQRRMMALTED